MSYLKVKIYFKSRLNFLLLIFFLKWCIVFLIFYELMKIVSNVSYHIILLKSRKPDISDFSAANFRVNWPDETQSEPFPLILLWNKYQLTGSIVLQHHFRENDLGKMPG